MDKLFYSRKFGFTGNKILTPTAPIPTSTIKQDVRATHLPTGTQVLEHICNTTFSDFDVIGKSLYFYGYTVNKSGFLDDIKQVADAKLTVKINDGEFLRMNGGELLTVPSGITKIKISIGTVIAETKAVFYLFLDIVSYNNRRFVPFYKPHFGHGHSLEAYAKLNTNDEQIVEVSSMPTITIGDVTIISMPDITIAAGQKVKITDGIDDALVTASGKLHVESSIIAMPLIGISAGQAVQIISGTGSGFKQTVDSAGKAHVTDLNSVFIKDAVETIDNFISGARGLVTEDNSAAIKTAVETIDNFISGARGLVTEDNSAAIKTAVEKIDNAIIGSEMQIDIVTMPNVTVSNTAKTITRTPVDLSLNGNLVAAGGAGIKIKVIGLFLMAAAATTIDITDGSGGANLIGTIDLADNQGFVLNLIQPDFNGNFAHWINTSNNTVLYLNMSTSVQVGGIVIHINES